MTRWTRLCALVAGALSVGCASGAELECEPLTGPWVLYEAAPAPEARGTAFDPTPELDAYTRAMAARLGRATGRPDVRVEAGGIPVSYKEDLQSGREGGSVAADCAQTVRVTLADGAVDTHILLDPTPPEGCPPVHVTLVHEGIHALAADAQHTERGIFRRFTDGTSYIDEGSLTELCSHFECTAFVPEL